MCMNVIVWLFVCSIVCFCVRSDPPGQVFIKVLIIQNTREEKRGIEVFDYLNQSGNTVKYRTISHN